MPQSYTTECGDVVYQHALLKLIFRRRGDWTLAAWTYDNDVVVICKVFLA